MRVDGEQSPLSRLNAREDRSTVATTHSCGSLCIASRLFERAVGRPSELLTQRNAKPHHLVLLDGPSYGHRSRGGDAFLFQNTPGSSMRARPRAGRYGHAAFPCSGRNFQRVTGVLFDTPGRGF